MGGQKATGGHGHAGTTSTVADVNATISMALGLNPAKNLVSPAGRPLKLADGQPIEELLRKEG